jgi:nicotinate phosphoribosyltransferase
MHTRTDDAARWALPIEDLRAGFFSAVYFTRAKEILEHSGRSRRVLMQVFQKNENTVICGVDEAIAVLQTASGRYADPARAEQMTRECRALDARLARATESPEIAGLAAERAEKTADLRALWRPAWDALSVHALPEGALAGSWETVMTIEGDYAAFAHLESVYLGILADRSGVATRTRRVVEAAAPRDVLFFGDRFKDFRAQIGDGYAAYVGGAQGVCTGAHGWAWGGEAGGTMPHALIAALDGSTVEAARTFADVYPDVPLVALVDYENDSVRTSLECARALGERLYAVRLDTSEKLVDESLRRAGIPDPLAQDVPARGVNPRLCENVRRALDAEGFSHVRIIASGGMTPERIAAMKEWVDAFGVGSSLLRGGNDFTADIVRVDDRPQSKVGRVHRPNERLVAVSEG